MEQAKEMWRRFRATPWWVQAATGLVLLIVIAGLLPASDDGAIEGDSAAPVTADRAPAAANATATSSDGSPATDVGASPSTAAPMSTESTAAPTTASENGCMDARQAVEQLRNLDSQTVCIEGVLQSFGDYGAGTDTPRTWAELREGFGGIRVEQFDPADVASLPRREPGAPCALVRVTGTASFSERPAGAVLTISPARIEVLDAAIVERRQGLCQDR